MILLDTNAVIWLEQDHPRARRLTLLRKRLYLSPATLLEIQFLAEAGRLRLRRGAQPCDVATRGRCSPDTPPAGGWFETALALNWTRDPFDRLIVAHALLRGWTLATGDAALIEHVGPDQCFEL